MPPLSTAASELEELHHPAIYAAFDMLLSLFLESTNLTQTSNMLTAVLPGQTCPLIDVLHPCFARETCMVLAGHSSSPGTVQQLARPGRCGNWVADGGLVMRGWHAGMEDVMREEAEAEAGLKPGWLMRCAFHMLSVMVELMKKAVTQGQTLRQYMYCRAAKAK